MRRKAFTLVELLIVVIILGLLAAIVVPQFSEATTDTNISSLRTNLSTIRGQLELYRLQHNNVYPTDATSFANQMTKKTDLDGTVNAATGKYGPYLQTIPANPINNSNEVTNSTADTAKGWYYDGATGTFKANDGKTFNGVATNTY
jgi:general secretion pathway protein G